MYRDSRSPAPVVQGHVGTVTTERELEIRFGVWHALMKEAFFIWLSYPKLSTDSVLVRPAGRDVFKFTDIARGAVMNHSTYFPVAMAGGASWDLDLQRRIGDAIGQEIRAQGELPRHRSAGGPRATASMSSRMEDDRAR
jgi:hypothetical protein